MKTYIKMALFVLASIATVAGAKLHYMYYPQGSDHGVLDGALLSSKYIPVEDPAQPAPEIDGYVFDQIIDL